MTAVILALAWVGAVGWPLALSGATIAAPRLVLQPLPLTLAAFLTFAWALGACAFLIEPQSLVVREVAVQSAAWRGPAVRVGVISDVHIGPYMSPERVRRIASRMNALDPDIVLLAGDYIAGHGAPDTRSAKENELYDEGLAALGDMDAPLGVVAILGNHDWWYDGERVEAALKAAGVAVLENAPLKVEREGRPFWIAGLADYHSDRTYPSWEDALDGAPQGDDVIGLAHWPDVFFDAPDRVALTVAGHTHCGQVVLPFIGPPAVSEGAAIWPCGLYDEEGRQLYVTGGVGVSMLPVRFRAPPEIVLVTVSGAQG